VCNVARPVRGGSLSEMTEVCETIEREMEDSGRFDLGYIRDGEEGEDGWDVSSASGAGLCDFSCRNAFTEVIPERSNTILEIHHVGPNPKTAQRPLGGPSLPSISIFSTPKVALSPSPFLLPAA